MPVPPVPSNPVLRPPHRPRPASRIGAALRVGGLLALALFAAGCALAPPDRARRAGRDGVHPDHPARTAPPSDLDVRLVSRTIVRTDAGEPLVRLDFSFVSYDGYVGEEDVFESTGTLYLPLGGDDRGRADGSRVLLVTEYPPGASRVAFPFLEEYGERPAAELGVPAAVVDVRGPIVSRLRAYVNPDDPSGGVFGSEEQFAYSMLRSFQATGDERFLWEYQAAGAWLRAIRAVHGVLLSETDALPELVMLCGERWGALAAAQAAMAETHVAAVAMAGWPLSWPDYHVVRDRRWVWESRYEPLDGIQPTGYRETRDVLSFLQSTRLAPDPGCPECEAGGDEWLRQYDVASLRASGHLRASLFLLEGDEDPDLPIDLTARAAMTRARWLMHAGDPQDLSPFSREISAYEDLRVLRGGSSYLARIDAAEAVRAWAQSLNGFRDLPRITTTESLVDGDLAVTIQVRTGNANVIDVSVREITAEPRRDWDFKAPLHREPLGKPDWRDVPTRYRGHTVDGSGEWEARIPLSAVANQAYTVSVRTRIGDVVTEHSVPIRPLWHGRDPAGR